MLLRQLDLFGRPFFVERTASGWSIHYPGSEGKRGPPLDLPIPYFIEDHDASQVEAEMRIRDQRDSNVTAHPVFSQRHSMSDESTATSGDPRSQRFYRGTKADLKPDDLIEPGNNSNFGTRKKAAYVYLTATLDAGISCAPGVRVMPSFQQSSLGRCPKIRPRFPDDSTPRAAG